MSVYDDFVRAVMNFPLSGPVTQLISPRTSWFSTVVNYRGTPEVERRVVEEVAGYGSQLGTLTDALVRLVGERPGAEFDRLRKLAADIEAVKETHGRRLVDRAKEALDELREKDEDGFSRLIAGYGRRAEEYKDAR